MTTAELLYDLNQLVIRVNAALPDDVEVRIDAVNIPARRVRLWIERSDHDPAQKSISLDELASLKTMDGAAAARFVTGE